MLPLRWNRVECGNVTEALLTSSASALNTDDAPSPQPSVIENEQPQLSLDTLTFVTETTSSEPANTEDDAEMGNESLAPQPKPKPPRPSQIIADKRRQSLENSKRSSSSGVQTRSQNTNKPSTPPSLGVGDGTPKVKNVPWISTKNFYSPILSPSPST